MVNLIWDFFFFKSSNARVCLVIINTVATFSKEKFFFFFTDVHQVFILILCLFSGCITSFLKSSFMHIHKIRIPALKIELFVYLFFLLLNLKARRDWIGGCVCCTWWRQWWWEPWIRGWKRIPVWIYFLIF